MDFDDDNYDDDNDDNDNSYKKGKNILQTFSMRIKIQSKLRSTMLDPMIIQTLTIQMKITTIKTK